MRTIGRKLLTTINTCSIVERSVNKGAGSMAEVIQFRNSSSLSFEDISSERWREYRFPDGQTVRIENPLKLHVSDNGHRIFDASGVSHYVPLGWVHLKWEAGDGEPHFVT